MSKCKHNIESPVVLSNGNVNCSTCGARLATTFAGSDFIGDPTALTDLLATPPALDTLKPSDAPSNPPQKEEISK